VLASQRFDLLDLFVLELLKGYMYNMELNGYIDYTLLRANASVREIQELCNKALAHNYYAVCVNPCMVATAKRTLFNTSVKVACVVGFPLGANAIETKVAETHTVLKLGADEIDLVINQSALRSKNEKYLEEELTAVRRACEGKVLKVIIETCNLDDDLLKFACEMCIKCGADFVKTSTGFASKGAELEVVEKMAFICGDRIKIKASGGIKTPEFATQLVKCGVMRIGTSTEL